MHRNWSSKLSLRYLLLNLLVMAGYFITAKLGQSLSDNTNQITLIWPPAGIALSFALLWGYWMLPGVLVGAILSRFIPGELPILSTYIALGNTLGAAVSVYLLRKFGFDKRLDSAWHVFLFIVLGALLAPSISASLGTASLVVNGVGGWESYWSTWTTWWLGDMIGILLFTPLLLVWLSKWISGSRGQIVKSVLVSFFVTATSLFIFFPQHHIFSNYPIQYLIFPILIWGVFNFGERGTTLSTLLIAIIAVTATTLGYGPFALSPSIETNLISLELFLIVLSTTSILVLSVIEEKSVAQQARDYDERKFRALIENSTDVFTLIDQEATIFYASPSLTKVIGFTVEDFVGTNVFAYIFEGDRERLRKLFGEILTSPGKTLTAEYRTLTKSGEVKWMEGIGTNLLEEPGVRGIALCYRDIDERKKLDLVKTQFVALASHQLRTPLTTMRWYTEALRNLVKGKAKLAEYTEAIYVSILKMSSLATLMLDVSRIELGTFEDRAEEIDLVKIVSSIASDFAPEISSKHLILNTHYPKIIPTIWTSPKLIHTVVQNILGNSIHYTNEHGQIDLSIKIQNQELQLAINDNGIGIPSSAQDKIFTKLFRAENSKRMMPDGTGLGLYLVKSIVERVGGKIWFISEENKGTTFYVNIPIKLAKRRTNVKA